MEGVVAVGSLEKKERPLNDGKCGFKCSIECMEKIFSLKRPNTYFSLLWILCFYERMEREADEECWSCMKFKGGSS